MKKRILLTSFLTIVFCLTLLVNATFALFTDEDQVNIAVTSGNVEYVASVEDLQAYSPTLLSTKGEILDGTNSANGLVFANGGTVELNGKELTLTNMTPGDKVTFDVAITNNSNVKSKYQTVLSVVEESKINEVLVVTINDIKYEGAAIESEWVALDPATNPEVVKVSIELPVEVDNEYKNLTTKLAITVSALQGNVAHEVPSIEVIDDDTLVKAIESGQDYTVKDGAFSKTIVGDNNTVTVNGGTFKNQVISARNGSTVIVNDANAGSVETGGGPNIIANITGGSTVIINGGSYLANTILTGDGTGTVEITGGYFDCGSLYYIFSGKPVANLTITGGTFSSMLVMGQGMMGANLADFVPETHMIVNNVDGSCTVVAK